MAERLFKTPDGKFVTVDEAYAQQALQRGYEPATEAQFEASKHPIQAGVESAARALTFGASDSFVGNLLDDNPARVAARATENPTAATVGGAVGMAPLALTGAGGVARGAAGLALREAAVGGLAGISSAMGEASLENQPLTAETLATHAVSGALMGGTLSLAGSGATALVSKGASTLTKKFGGKTLSDVLKDASAGIDERILLKGDSGGLQRLARRGGTPRGVVDFARKEGIPLDFTPENLDKVIAVQRRVGAEVGDAFRVMDETRPFGAALEEGVTSAGRPKAIAARDVQANLIQRVEDRIKERFKGDLAHREELGKFLAKELEPLKADSEVTWQGLYKLQEKMREMVGYGELGVKKKVYDIGRKELRDAIFSEAEKAGVIGAGEMKRLQTEYAQTAFLEDVFKRNLGKDAARGFGPNLMGMAGGALFGGGNPLGGLAGAYGAQFAREKGPGLISAALRKMAESKVLAGGAKSLANHFESILSISPEILGPFKGAILQAAAHGPDAILATHLQLANGPHGQDYMARTGLEPENAQETQQFGAKLAILESMKHAELAKQATLDEAVNGLFLQKRKTPTLAKTTPDDFETITNNIKNILTNPESVFGAVPPDVNAAAPATANAAMATVMKAAQYLDSKAPKNPYAGLPPSVAQKWQPSPVDLDRFGRYKQAVENPEVVLKNMANGYISPEQVEAIKAVYPALYEDLRQKIGERLMEQTKPITYQQKMAFGMLLGPAAVGMSHQQVQILQSATNQLSSGKDGAAGAKPDGRQVVDQNKNLETQAQRLEER